MYLAGTCLEASKGVSQAKELDVAAPQPMRYGASDLYKDWSSTMRIPTKIQPSPWILTLLMWTLLAGTSAAQQNPLQGNAPAENPPARVARVSYLKGNTSFLRAGLEQ